MAGKEEREERKNIVKWWCQGKGRVEVHGRLEGWGWQGRRDGDKLVCLTKSVACANYPRRLHLTNVVAEVLLAKVFMPKSGCRPDPTSDKCIYMLFFLQGRGRVVLVKTSWQYCGEWKQCSIRLEAFGYLCAGCLLLQSTRPSVTWFNSRWWLAACDWVMTAFSAIL